MSKEVLEQKIWHCIEMLSENVDVMADDRFGLDTDYLMCAVDECRDLLDRLESHLEQYENEEN